MLVVIRKLIRNYCVLSFFPGIFIVTPRKSQVVVFQHANFPYQKSTILASKTARSQVTVEVIHIVSLGLGYKKIEGK